MYVLSIFLLMLVAPLISATIDAGSSNGILRPNILGKWFVFWAVGARLFIAGVRQIAKPRYTAETILGIRAPEAQLVVRELGFANFALGLVGLGSLIVPAGRMLAVVSGAVFYGLVGINHLLHRSRNPLQSVAMISDVVACAALSIFAIAK